MNKIPSQDITVAQIHWNWSYRQLLAVMWLLEIKSWSRKVASHFNL